MARGLRVSGPNVRNLSGLALVFPSSHVSRKQKQANPVSTVVACGDASCTWPGCEFCEEHSRAIFFHGDCRIGGKERERCGGPSMLDFVE